MASLTLTDRVVDLEDLMADLIQVQAVTVRNLDRLSLEMREFKDEMREFKDEMRHDRKRMNRQWGELSRKMGTMAEDLVAPSVPRILRRVVNCSEEELDTIAVRVRRRHPLQRGWRQEFDVVATCGRYWLVNETKSSLRPEDVTKFVALLQETRDFFPEHEDKQLVGAIASLYVDESLVRYAERQGVVVLGLGEELMDVLNSPGFVPTFF